MATSKTDKNKDKDKKKAEILFSNFEIGGAVYKTTIPDRYKHRSVWKGRKEGEIYSMITGSVKKFFVKEGSKVTKGDCLLLLEAMKMNNEILSPVSGTVKEILVTENKPISKGTLMLVINPDTKTDDIPPEPEENIFEMQMDY